MLIGLNLLHALPDIGGVWNYIERLISGLAKYDRENRYVCFVTERSRSLVPNQDNFIIFTTRLDSRSRIMRILYENSMLQFHMNRAGLDVMHWFSNTQSLINIKPSVVSIYDTFVFDQPSAFPLIKRIYLKHMFRYTSDHATLLMPMSNTTADNLGRILHVRKAKMQVILPIIDDAFYPRRSEEVLAFRAKYRLPDLFWLYVADFYPHKNHLGLVSALHKLKKNGTKVWPLVLRGDDRGSAKYVFREINDLGLRDDILLVPRLSSEELAVLYSAATALIYPSLYEGAGMPVIEAMACGCPVAASSIPAVIELAGDAAFIYNQKNTGSIESAMVFIQRNNDIRERHSKMGFVKSAEYRTSRVIEKVVASYTMAVMRPSN